MKIAVALLLNAGALWALVWWLRRQRPLLALEKLAVVLLLVRLALAVLLTRELVDDALYYQQWSGLMTQQLWQEPLSWFRTLGLQEFHFQGNDLVFHGFANTLFLLKLLSALNVITGGVAWLTAFYLSAFTLWGGYYLTRMIVRVFPLVPALAPVIALLLWPSMLFFTSGLTKESVFLGSAMGLTAVVLKVCYDEQPVRWYTVVGGLLLAGLLFEMRFFFAVFLLAGLAFLLLMVGLRRIGVAVPRVVQVAVLLLLVAGGANVAGEVLPVFTANKFTNQVTHNYRVLTERSQGKPRLVYPDLKPTLTSIAGYAPQAALNTLVRPYWGDGGGWKYRAMELENVLILVLSAVCLWSLVRGQPGYLPFTVVLVLGFYCLCLAALIGLTTPNLGTLSRYRTAFLPFLLLLLLQNPYVAHWLRLPRWLQ